MPKDEAKRTTDRPGLDDARASGPPQRRRTGRLLTIAVAIVLVGKLALIATSYVDGLAGALAIAADAHSAKPPQVASAKESAGAAGGLASVAPSDRAKGLAPAGDAARPADGGGKPAEVRALVDAITRRQGELEERERDVAAREERLRVYEQDVIAKIASLEEIEKRLQARAKAATAAVDAAAESLAKVYGAMKPAEAAPILERLDETTVLTIFGRMKEKQIGEILPLMTKEKAIALTQALVTSGGR